eukprot:Em0051g25a
MSKPISEDLVKLEQEGVIVYDVLYKEMVLVIAPLMCIICDNPRASELLNHLGSSALKYCRVCMCDKTENPDELSELRTMALALQQIAEIAALWTKQEKIETRKLYGHIRNICHGGNFSSDERCGDTLKMIFLTPVMQHIMCGIPVEDLQGAQAIYQPGAPRKKGLKIYLKNLPLTLAGK